MPFFRRRRPRRRFRRRYRRRYRRRAKPRIRRSLGGNQLFVKQKIYDTTVVAAGTPFPIIDQESFSLQQIPAAQLAAYRVLFDQYQILGVAIRWYLTSNTVAGSSIPACTFAYSVDRDEGGTPVDWETFLQRSNTRTKIMCGNGGLTQRFKSFLKPRPLNALYESAVSTAYGVGRKALIDISDPATPHYGIVWGLNSAFSGAMPAFNINKEYTFYLKFRQVR